MNYGKHMHYDPTLQRVVYTEPDIEWIKQRDSERAQMEEKERIEEQKQAEVTAAKQKADAHRMNDGEVADATDWKAVALSLQARLDYLEMLLALEGNNSKSNT